MRVIHTTKSKIDVSTCLNLGATEISATAAAAAAAVTAAGHGHGHSHGSGEGDDQEAASSSHDCGGGGCEHASHAKEAGEACAHDHSITTLSVCVKGNLDRVKLEKGLGAILWDDLNIPDSQVMLEPNTLLTLSAVETKYP